MDSIDHKSALLTVLFEIHNRLADIADKGTNTLPRYSYEFEEQAGGIDVKYTFGQPPHEDEEGGDTQPPY